MTTYVAVIHKDKDSAYGVSFPDCPGCFSAGDTMAEAVRNAVEALRTWAEAMTSEGHDVPAPRDLDKVLVDPDVIADLAEGATTMLIPMLAEFAPRKPYTIKMAADLMTTVDVQAKARGMTRSAFLAKAAQDKIAAG